MPENDNAMDQRIGGLRSATRLLEQAEGLTNRGNLLEARAAYAGALDLSKKDPDPAVRSKAIQGLDLVGFLLIQQGRFEESAETWDETVKRFSDTMDPELKRDVSHAENLIATAMIALHRYPDALATCDRSIHRLGDAVNVQDKYQVTHALCTKADALARMGRNDDALLAYEQAIRWFHQRTYKERGSEVLLATSMADAFLGKGRLLVQMGRQDDAVSAFSQAITAFKKIPLCAESVKKARRERRAAVLGIAVEASKMWQQAGGPARWAAMKRQWRGP